MTVLDFGATERAGPNGSRAITKRLTLWRRVAYGIAILMVLLQLATTFTGRDLDGGDRQLVRLLSVGSFIVGALLGELIALNRRIQALEARPAQTLETAGGVG